MATQDDITRLNFQHPYVRPIDRRDLDDLCPVIISDVRTEHEIVSTGFFLAPLGEAIGSDLFEPRDTVVGTEFEITSTSYGMAPHKGADDLGTFEVQASSPGIEMPTTATSYSATP